MSDLEVTLTWLGMSQYLESFLQAGFDSWETVLEITEEDLETLGVEIGHRRKLQREIANARHSSQTSSVVSFSQQTSPSSGKRSSAAQLAVTKQESQLPASSKRGYRHHPKPDENAPVRPYSAYVMFSNFIREEMKEELLPFAEISRQVGEKWQKLSPEAKEEWKEKAAGPWQRYKQELGEYQKTENFRRYSQYVADFNAAQSGRRNATKGEGSSGVSSARMPVGKPGQFQVQHGPGMTLSSLPISHDPRATGMALHGTSTPMRAPDPEPRDVKRQESGVPIPRINWSAASGFAAGVPLATRPSRVTQACEPCRHRKSKCDGERPSCRQCSGLSAECYYQGGKKDSGKKYVLPHRNMPYNNTDIPQADRTTLEESQGL